MVLGELFVIPLIVCILLSHKINYSYDFFYEKNFLRGLGMRGYWTLTWFGLISNTLAIPFIAYVVGSGPPLHTANITLAISLAWPSAVTGIVASAGLFAQRGWGVILSIVALSMTLSGTLPYGIIRLIRVEDFLGISGLTLLIALLNLLALLYWCRRGHRRIRL